jgi:hypothetical protein
MAKTNLTVARLRDVLHYELCTGTFVWNISTGYRAVVGALAGSVSPKGYLKIGIDKHVYYAHQLAWLYVFEQWPKLQIDHVDGNRLNNQISNLRDVSKYVNAQNQRRAQNRSKTGLLGVSLCGDSYRTDIFINKKNKYLGLFSTPELAHAAYLEAKRKHHAGCTI